MGTHSIAYWGWQTRKLIHQFLLLINLWPAHQRLLRARDKSCLLEMSESDKWVGWGVPPSANYQANIDAENVGGTIPISILIKSIIKWLGSSEFNCVILFIVWPRDYPYVPHDTQPKTSSVHQPRSSYSFLDRNLHPPTMSPQ